MPDKELRISTGIAQQKLPRASRRDQELIKFARQMGKAARLSDDVAERSDARFWFELADHIETTDEDGVPLPPVERPRTWTTHRLARMERGRLMVDRLMVEEVGFLRDAGAPWESIGEAVGMTREGARRRFSK